MSDQKDNIVQGDLAGRDIIKSEYHYPPVLPTYMSELIEKFKEEHEKGIFTTNIIDKLAHYKTAIDNSEVIGLEKKLHEGDYSYLLEYATSTKEIFTKKLVRYQLYESAQKIFVCILSEIFSNYHLHVYPLIKRGESSDQVLSAIQKHVIDPVQCKLEKNILEILAEDINGAIYFLTGNCHIKWI